MTYDKVLSPYVFVFWAAYLMAFMFTPVMRMVAAHYGIVDRPDALRKMHARPVAYLGGIAVFMGWVAGLAISQLVHLHFTDLPNYKLLASNRHPLVPVGIVMGAIIVVALGLVDDMRGIRPKIKIIGQVVAAGGLLWAGIGDETLRPFVENVTARLELWFEFTMAQEELDLAIHLSSGMLTIALVVFCCNAANLMDGLDGLCGGVTGIIAIGLLFLCIVIAMDVVPTRVNQDATRLVVALAFLGGVLAFVPFNFNPASIFMGDAGSMFLGFVCATLILMIGQVEAKWLVAGLVMFSLPVLDTALAFARRWLAGRPLFSADKHHFHHQLVARGMSVRKAVLTAYGLTLFFVVLGGAIVFIRTRFAVSIYLVIFGSILVAAYKMGMVHERITRKPTPHVRPEPATEAAGSGS